MKIEYEFLRKHMAKNYKEDIIKIEKNNFFVSIDEEEIVNAESKMGRAFPSELRDFYQSIGSGHLTTPENPPLEYQFHASNEILPPHIAVDYMLGILEHPEEEYYMSDFTSEAIKPGDLPFFEICDSSRYLIMKLDSDNPNAIWTVSGIKIEDSFEKFIFRLYYESPWFYDEIIEAHYA